MANWEQQKRFLDFFEKHGVTYVNLATLSQPQVGDKRIMKGDGRARDRAETEKSLGWAWHENRAGGEVYIRPARWLPSGEQASWSLVFLDDVTPAQAEKIAAQFSAMVVETSPGRCHVWLAVSRPLPERERKALQQRLIVEQGGDPGSVSGEHFGRLPGFKNNKREGCWVNIKTITIGAGRLYPVPVDLEAEAPFPFARDKEAVSQRAACASESEREFGYVIGRLRWLSQSSPERLQEEAERLTDELIERARARGKRNPSQYARRTVAAALARLR